MAGSQFRGMAGSQFRVDAILSSTLEGWFYCRCRTGDYLFAAREFNCFLLRDNILFCYGFNLCAPRHTALRRHLYTIDLYKTVTIGLKHSCWIIRLLKQWQALMLSSPRDDGVRETWTGYSAESADLGAQQLRACRRLCQMDRHRTVILSRGDPNNTVYPPAAANWSRMKQRSPFCIWIRNTIKQDQINQSIQCLFWVHICQYVANEYSHIENRYPHVHDAGIQSTSSKNKNKNLKRWVLCICWFLWKHEMHL
jgi:hypothetical protein